MFFNKLEAYNEFDPIVDIASNSYLTSFYSGNVSHGLEDIGYHFEIDFDSRRNDPEQGAFKNRDFLYESIMKYLITKNSNLERKEIKGKK